MESKYKKLIKNTAILSIGEFANKILSFLIVPLYTYVLTTEEYGQIDLFTTTISLIVPALNLEMQEALVRFVLGKEIDRKTAVSNCWLVYLVGVLFVLVLFPICVTVYKDTVLAIIFCAALLMSGFNSVFIHYLRITEKMVEYAAKGVLGTIINLSLNVLFVLIWRLGLYGYLYAMLISQFVGIIYLFFVCDLRKHLHIKKADKYSLIEMLRYSVPLIPNTLMWWIMSSGDKYIINYFLGNGANGLYSLALKIPTIITLFYSFFFQAWHMAAIEEKDSAERSSFYENIYKSTNALLLLMVSGITLIVKSFYEVAIGEQFTSAWMYVPLLSLSMAFSCQSSFFGVVYTTTKKTSKAFSTTALGAVTNLLFNFLLIQHMGLQGVAVGTCLGYLIVTLVRAYDMRQEIKFSLDLRRLVMSMIVILGQIAMTLRSDSMVNCGGCFCIVLLIFIYRDEVLKILLVIKKKLLQKSVKK